MPRTAVEYGRLGPDRRAPLVPEHSSFLGKAITVGRFGFDGTVLAVNHALVHGAGKLAVITPAIGAISSATPSVDPRSVKGPANIGRLVGR